MKNIISIFALAISQVAFSQVIIGDNEGTSENKTSVLLEFSKKESRGLILPYVTNISPTTAEGTILLDATNDGTNAKVKFYNGTWKDLSEYDSTSIISTENYINSNITSFLSIQNNKTEATNGKAIIGASSSEADGVLVLESTTKAMVLPTVASVKDIINPSPGMIVFVSGKAENDEYKQKRFAVFNGKQWSFWAP